MNYLLNGAYLFSTGEKNPVVKTCENSVDTTVEHFPGCVVFPSFCDMHVHFREPGFSYKETIQTGAAAAVAGGFTDVAVMPNVEPCPDTLGRLQVMEHLIDTTDTCRVHPYGALTRGRNGKIPADIEQMAARVIAFSDDGSGVEDGKVMEDCMRLAKENGKIVCAHCEDMALRKGGYIHDGVYAARTGHLGISSESEYAQIARDLELVNKTGCAYHVCHISTKESVELIRAAKACGMDVTCETAPHYLVLDERDLQEDGRFKMNPPLRGEKDKEALIAGIKDGTIDMIATDHAPHSYEEKAKGLKDSAMGVVGLETAFAVLYTHLVMNGVISLEKLIALMAENPRKRFGIPRRAGDFCVFDLQTPYTVDPQKFYSKGKSSPFAGRTLYGICMETVCDGKVVYKRK